MCLGLEAVTVAWCKAWWTDQLPTATHSSTPKEMSASNVVTKRQDELEYVVDKMMTGEVQWGTVEDWLLPSIPSRTTTPSSTPTEPPAHVVAERQVSHSLQRIEACKHQQPKP